MAQTEPNPEPEPAKPSAGPQLILVSDTENGRVVQMEDFEATNWQEIGFPGFGLGRLLLPHQVWMDPDKKILIADTGNNRIIQINDITGRGWSEMQGFSKPEGVCVSDGKLYISDTEADRVLVYDGFGGKLLETITHNEMKRPTALWADYQGHLFICSGLTPPGGTLFETYVSHGYRRYKQYKGDGLKGVQSISPGQAVTSRRKLAFIDSSGHRLVRLDSIKGQSVHSHGRYGPDPDQFRRPQGLAIDTEDNLYVADTGNDRLVKVTEFGTGEYSLCRGGLGSERAFRGPTSIFIYSPAPVPPPPSDDEDEKGKKKKKKKKKKK